MPDPFVLLGDGALAGRGPDAELDLDEDTAHHLRRVRRLEAGAPLVVSDGAGRVADAVLEPEGARLVTGPRRRRPPRPALHVLQALPKGRAMEEIVRVLTELGVARVTPLESARTVRELDGDRRDKALRRWRSIAAAACRQARRAHRPVVDPPRPLGEAVASADGTLLAAHVGADADLGRVLGRLSDPERVVVAVGPEGGWSPEEVGALGSAGRLVAVGDTVLRTEHAATVVSAAVAQATGWYG